MDIIWVKIVFIESHLFTCIRLQRTFYGQYICFMLFYYAWYKTVFNKLLQ